MLFFLIRFLISFLLLFFYFISFFFLKGGEKSSSFECGFVNLSDIRNSFSVQFFLFTLIFLVFDIEVSFLLPIPILYYTFFYSYFCIFFFLFVLMVGFFYEYLKGVFDWSF